MRHEWEDSAPAYEGQRFAVEGGADGFGGAYLKPSATWPWLHSMDAGYRVDHQSIYGREILRLAGFKAMLDEIVLAVGYPTLRPDAYGEFVEKAKALAARVEELEADALMPTSEVRLLAQRWQERAEEAQEHLDEVTLLLSRLDALLASEEVPEEIFRAVIGCAPDQAWRWIREQLGAEP